MAIDSINDFWIEFGIWLGMNIVVAGFLCIVLLLVKDHFSGRKGCFYVLNKVGYTGYFYAWSITLLAGSLSNLFRCMVLGQISKGEVLLTVVIIAISILWLVVVVVGYLSYNVQASDMNAEKVVKSLELKKLAGDDLYEQYDTKKIDADTLIAQILESKGAEGIWHDIDNSIDKNQLADTLLRVKVKIEDPRFHWNTFYIVLTVISFLVALASYVFTYFRLS